MPEHTQNGQGGSKHVHPFVAWMAILSFAMVFSLAPSLLIAQRTAMAAEVAAVVVGTGPVLTPEITSCRHACYDAHAVCVKSAGTDEAAANQCSTTGKDCLSKCGPEQSASPGDRAQPSANDACMRGCNTSKLDCMQSAAGNPAAMHACIETGTACFSTCGVKGDASMKSPTSTAVDGTKTPRQAYLDATRAARQAYQDALKKAKADYAAALKQAKADYKATTPTSAAN